MTRTIFRSTFLVGALVTLLCAALFFSLQYTQRREETYAALRQEAIYAEQGLAAGGLAYLRALDDANRVTWIAPDGEVLYDSEAAPPVPGQQDCPEVIAALADGEGQGIRRSGSSGRTAMYYARRCADGTILRLSRPLSALRYALAAVSPVLWVLLLVIMLSGVLAFRVSRQIVRPINEMDLDSPDEGSYPELKPLIGKLREQRLTIQEEVASRERMRREFSANVSHELKTPLTAISGFAEVMAEGLADEATMQEFARDIHKEAARLMTLIDDILRLSRLDEEELGPERQEVELRALARGVLESLAPAAEKQNITLHLTGGPARVLGVHRILSEMVYNLCDNAVKYNRPGGSVTVHTAVTADGGASLAVADTGIGIPPDHQKRVFERFYRVDKSHSREIGGTGLGLSIVKTGARLHDASLRLESAPGAGTTVTLLFPPGGEA